MLSVALQLPLADWKSIFFLENHRLDSAGNRGVNVPESTLVGALPAYTIH